MGVPPSPSVASALGPEPSPVPAPVPDPEFAGDLGADAIAIEDRVRLQKFRAELEQDTMAECSRCKQKWFDIKLQDDGVCKPCHSRDRTRLPLDPEFFSAANDLDFGDVPAHLPQLSQVEEQLIARVHVHVEVFLYRGQQYKYRGHVVNFLRDVGKVYSQLPRLPRELDIILLRPSNFNQQPHVVRQFRRNFYVKQSNIRIWLAYLVANHPAYRDVVVSEERLSQLPEGDNIIDQLPVETIGEVDIEELVNEADDESFMVDEAAIPNVVAEEANLDQLRQQLGPRQSQHPEQPPLAQQDVQPYIEMGEIRRTPLNEFNRSQALLS
jgi:hypothetical protein